MLEDLLREHGVPILRKVNKIKIPVYRINITEEGAHEFNSYYAEIKETGYNKIVRTPSGGVSIDKRNFRPPMWDVLYSRSCLEMTIIAYGYMLRIQFRHCINLLDADEEEHGKKRKMYGRQAIARFKQELLKDGFDLDTYAIENGEEVKKTIPSPIIRLAKKGITGKDVILENCHHLDFHNSFPAGLVNTHPEFGRTVRRLYDRRKTNATYKAVLNLTVGYFHTLKDGNAARWAHLAKDAIADNNDRLMEISQRLAENDRRVLLWNTDGVWYQGEIFHGEGEGKALGEWENDHVNCRLRIKSAGAYEFIEDGKYYPVLRGYTKLDEALPRTEWEWGDIFQERADELIQFFWIEGVGLVDKEENLV